MTQAEQVGQAVLRDEAWGLMIRRSFGVPDVVGDEVATDVITRTLADENDVGIWQTYSTAVNMNADPAPKITRVSLDAMIVALKRGDADRFLVGDPGVNLDRLTRQVANQDRPDREWVAWGVVGTVLERVKAFIDAHPFQSPCGCYFS